MFIRVLIFVIVALPALSSAWGQKGHAVVGLVAEEHLTPATKTAVSDLLGLETLAGVASWPDQVRGDRPQTAPWHYINWPLPDDEPTTHPLQMAEQNVVWATMQQLEILSDPDQSDELRAEALKYVVHFVGDLHQPLHAGAGDDRGGNDIDVLFDGAEKNLHHVWDTAIIESWGLSKEQIANHLLLDLPIEEQQEIMQGDAYDWTVESHAIVRDTAYPSLPPQEDTDLLDTYAIEMTPVIKQQLLEAGLRLAMVLNAALDRSAVASWTSQDF